MVVKKTVLLLASASIIFLETTINPEFCIL